jgi:ActR/RegA family two-component response regulator
MATILVCEDDPFLASDLVQTIELAGHKVEGPYARAQDVMALPDLTKFDLALIDLELADGDTGASLARVLQKAGVRLIILSGHTNARAALGAVPHIYAAKPASCELIEHLLGTCAVPA